MPSATGADEPSARLCSGVRVRALDEDAATSDVRRALGEDGAWPRRKAVGDALAEPARTGDVVNMVSGASLESVGRGVMAEERRPRSALRLYH